MKAADAGVTLRASDKEYFLALTIASSNYLNFSRVNHYAALTAIGISNTDPDYCKIRDGIYASMRGEVKGADP